MWKFIRSRIDSFKPALEGLQYVLKTQPNAWVHAFISIAVIALGFWVDLDINSWAVIILTMALVWVTEFANTAIEAVVDVASPDYHPLAKVAKDVSAAAVVIAAMAAVIVGLLILGSQLWERISVLISPN
jgi:diacylglycerol kinase (ATP)